MQQKGDLEKYLRSPNALDPSIEIELLDAQKSLFGEELELKKYKTGIGGRWAMLGVNYEAGKIVSAEVCFYAAEADTAQRAAGEVTALAVIEKNLESSGYQTDFDKSDFYLTASGDNEGFVRKAVQGVNAFLK